MFKFSVIRILIVAGYFSTGLANSINRDEKFALSRDAFGRDDPDKLLSGFFAPWPFVLFLIAGTFGLFSLISILAHTMGYCRNPKK